MTPKNNINRKLSGFNRRIRYWVFGKCAKAVIREMEFP